MRSLGITIALLLALTSMSRTQDAAPSRPRSIVIDPGHGGEDLGARGAGGLEEKRLVLDVAIRLRTILEQQPSLRVVLTREDDRTLPPDERAAIANAAKGDMFLSLHANAAPAASVSGAEVYYNFREAAQGALARVTEEPLLLVPWDDAQSRQLEMSAQLAGLVEEELRRRVPMSRRSIRQAPLRVLRGATMPAVLVEMLFLTNTAQEQAASTPALKDTLATAIAEAVSRFHVVLNPPLVP